MGKASKIKEIKSRIGNIKEINSSENNSKLESNVAKAEAQEFAEFMTSSRSSRQTTGLSIGRLDSQAQNSQNSSTQNQSRQQPQQPQTDIYNSNVENKIAYETSERQTRRATSATSHSQSILRQRNINQSQDQVLGSSQELDRLRGAGEKSYAEPLNTMDKKERKREIWEGG
jgi:hypothetical protein